MQSWSIFRAAFVHLYAIFYSMFFLLHGSGYAQSSLPSSAETTSTIHVSSQFVVLDALVENKKTGS